MPGAVMGCLYDYLYIGHCLRLVGVNYLSRNVIIQYALLHKWVTLSILYLL
jgi:hypothetical protein